MIVLQIKNKNLNSHFQDYLIFFKLYGNSNNRQSNFDRKNSQKVQNDLQKVTNTEECMTYDFYVSYRNTDFKDVNLLDTVNQKTKVNEKIAPGTKGEFSIQVHSNQKSKYQVKFESLNQKPYNLKFHIKGENKEYRTLEELQQNLDGQVNARETKQIDICWEWKYESESSTSQIQDTQDAIDGICIQRYQFKIYVVGQAI